MGFETVVRPTVFPDIRPAPAQPISSPAGSAATIRGSGGKTVQLTNSYSSSASTSAKKEYKRRSDKVRVYQMNSPVNKDNYIDIEIANKIWMRGGATAGSGGKVRPEEGAWTFREVEKAENIEILQKDIIRTTT